MTTRGQLAIDNNAAERTLRGLAIGRKNWLFVGSEHGGHTAATILTLITSATRHHLDHFAYLRDLLRRLPTTTQDASHQLAPQPLATRLSPTNYVICRTLTIGLIRNTSSSMTNDDEG